MITDRDIHDSQTLEHLKEMLIQIMPDCVVDTNGYEILIFTGLTMDMGNLLYPISDME